MNGGFFDTNNGACHGAIVSRGRVVQDSSKHNARIGITKGGQFVAGYFNISDFELTEVITGMCPTSAASQVGDLEFAGVEWIVRNGEDWIDQTLLEEDMSIQAAHSSIPVLIYSPLIHSPFIHSRLTHSSLTSHLFTLTSQRDQSCNHFEFQETGDAFTTIISARTAIGFGRHGELLMLTISVTKCTVVQQGVNGGCATGPVICSRGLTAAHGAAND